MTAMTHDNGVPTGDPGLVLIIGDRGQKVVSRDIGKSWALPES